MKDNQFEDEDLKNDSQIPENQENQENKINEEEKINVSILSTLLSLSALCQWRMSFPSFYDC